MKKKKSIVLMLTCILGYLLLLALLAFAEREGMNAGNFDAFWYSLETMTTVGYGDMVPETWLGRVIGCIFMLMSIGILTSLFSLAYSLMVGRLIPRLQLWRYRRRNWHVFPKSNRQSQSLAGSLKQSDPESVTIFLENEDAGNITGADIVVRLTPERLCSLGKRTISFYFLENTLESCRRAAALARTHQPVYCSADFSEYDGMECFQPAQSCARQFWSRHPLCENEQSIVLIGGQRWMPALLEQALLVNLYDTEQSLQYRVYGDDGSFRRNHFRLRECFPDTAPVPGTDGVYFHEGLPDPEILGEAHRILLCLDTDEENLAMLETLRNYYPFTAQVYIRLEHGVSLPGKTTCFGTVEELYTPQNVIHHALDRTAMLTHALYCRQNPQSAQPWETLTPELKAANFASADHLLTKLQILMQDRSITEITPDVCARAHEAYLQQQPLRKDFFRKLEHMRWCRFLYLRNWTYGDGRKNPEKRTHPMLRDYGTLPADEQEKNDNPWLVIGQLFTE